MSTQDILMLDYHGPGVSLLDLPDEVIEHIVLSSVVLKTVDVVALSSTCHRLQRVLLRSAAIWKTLFSTTFVEISRSVEKMVETMAQNGDDDLHTLWQKLFVRRFLAGKLVRLEVGKMSKKLFHRQDLSNLDMVNFVDLIPEFDEQTKDLEDPQHTKQGKLFLIDALQSLVSDSNPTKDLTIRYYARKVLRYIRCRFITEKWNEFKNKPVHEQSYYQGLVLFSQWFQPHETIHLSKVTSDVEMIALDTLRTLMTKTPDHPIFRHQELGQPKAGSLRQYLTEQDTILSKDLYPGKFGLLILDALNFTMFEEKGFQGNSSNYYSPANSYIDQVLSRRQGIPITLCILYHLVAKRLGILCQPVNAPRHFLLQWRYCDVTSQSEEFLYIDAFNRGNRQTTDEINAQEQGLANNNISIATPLEVFQRMTRNLVTCAQIQQQETLNLQMTVFPLLKSALELTTVIGRPDEYPGFGLCQIYLQMNINHREILQELNNWSNWPQNLWLAGDNEHLQVQIESLKRLCLNQMKENFKEQEELSQRRPSLRSDFANALENKDNSEKMRTNKLDEETDNSGATGNFCIGMVMRHKRYNYFCVIFGWDPVCKASKSWIRQMGVDRLSRKEKQPFYNVLVDDGSIRYAADENLEPVKPRRIYHPLIGKYFRQYHETFGYEANEEQARLYPQDFEHLIQSKRTF